MKSHFQLCWNAPSIIGVSLNLPEVHFEQVCVSVCVFCFCGLCSVSAPRLEHPARRVVDCTFHGALRLEARCSLQRSVRPRSLLSGGHAAVCLTRPSADFGGCVHAFAFRNNMWCLMYIFSHLCKCVCGRDSYRVLPAFIIVTGIATLLSVRSHPHFPPTSLSASTLAWRRILQPLTLPWETLFSSQF